MLHTKIARECRTESVNPPAVPLTPSIFPDDASAIIYKPTRSAMTSGKARTREWKLRFEPRSPPVIEPLMGWTAGEDTLTQVELTFSSVEAAIAYARRQGLEFMVQGAGDAAAELRGRADSVGRNGNSSQPLPQIQLEGAERTHGPDITPNRLGPEHDPAKNYASPRDVLNDDGLLPGQKQEVLRRWALDVYKMELLRGHQPGSGPSSLAELIDAMLDLDELQESRRVRQAARKPPKLPASLEAARPEGGRGEAKRIEEKHTRERRATSDHVSNGPAFCSAGPIRPFEGTSRNA
jgi:ETC complex I subunit conserved region